MANVDSAMGFRPAFHLTGGVIRMQRYLIASGLANDIGYGDLVMKVSSGRHIDAVDGAEGDPPGILGSFAGVQYTAADGTPTWSREWITGTTTLGSADAVAFVYDDPFIIYEVQCDSGTAFAETDIGLAADVAYTEPAANGISRSELDTSNINTGKHLYIYDMVRREDNAVGEHAKVYVMINEHAYRNGGVVSGQSV